MITPQKSSYTAPNGRITIGFLLASLHTGASRALFPGLVDSAAQHDVNLICFPGGRLRAVDLFEDQRNLIYDLVSDACVDGIVTWSSSLGGVLDPSQVNAFHQRFQRLPMISLAQFMEGIPTVSIDSYQGMRSLLTHLIQDHGYRRLAFIRGPETHFYAQERYRAYLDALQAFDIPLAPELITRPLRWESGAEAIQILLDERGLRPGVDFQALVAPSDLLALWAQKTLQERGCKIPDDLAVTGFNNSIEGRLATPLLTTLALPFYEQGAKSVDMLLTQLSGKPVPALITMPSRLVVRQSCGCPSAAVSQAANLPGDGSLAQGSALLAEVAAAAGVGDEKIPAWIAPLVEAVEQGPFLTVLEDVLNQAIQDGRDIGLWHGALSLLRVHALARTPADQRAGVETRFAQARVIVSEAIQRFHAYWQWQAERQADALQETIRTLLTTFDIPKLADVLVEHLPLLGIPSAYLVLYENPGESLEYATLMMAYTEQGRADLGAQGQRFVTRELIPPERLPQERRYSMVVEPLYFQDKPIGYMLLEIGPKEGDIYELLRSNLSSALQGALLFQENQQARLIAEKADRVKTHLLANVSHELRTPLNIILGYTQEMLNPAKEAPSAISPPLPPALTNDIQHIQRNAAHQLRVINDLLDLSRAEIDELDLYMELLDPYPLLVEAFHSLADQSTPAGVEWRLEIPERLPLIRADAVRLRQIILNLLSNAAKFTSSGSITLGAEVAPPKIHFWVADTGPGIAPDQLERIFEPFITAVDGSAPAGGIGLGLSITRHLVILHGGVMSLESQLGQGSTFHFTIPLPAVSQARPASPEKAARLLLVVSSAEKPAPEIEQISQRQNLTVQYLRSSEDLEAALIGPQPAAVAWDLTGALPADWALVRRLRLAPGVSQAPFILYGQVGGESPAAAGLTSFMIKPTESQLLLDAIKVVTPAQAGGDILIVDDEPETRAAHRALIEKGLPGYSIRSAEDGEDALNAMRANTPALVLLDLVMPNLGGMEVLDEMRADPRLRHVPVIILSNKILNLDDVRRIEQHARVVLQSKGIWSADELAAALNRALFGTDALPTQTSGLVKQAVAYLHQNYGRPLSRWEIAEAIGVSEDYLSRVFNRELGISPWDYLNKFRVLQAKSLLANSAESIGSIARKVGFKDQGYFSRVFHKMTGASPQEFRDGKAGTG